MVLNVFMLGLSDENLAMSLQMEYSKSCYVARPPSVNELRAYVRRLESSGRLRNMKSAELNGRGPSYQVKRDGYAPRLRRINKCEPNKLISRVTSTLRQSTGIDKVAGMQCLGSRHML